MTTSGDVEITIEDGTAGTVVVPASQVQLVIGCAVGGTAATVVPTRSTTTLESTFTQGGLMQAAGLSVLGGGTVLAMKAAKATNGYVRGSETATKAITGASVATPIVITAVAHGFVDEQVITIASVGGTVEANGTWIINVLTVDTFELVGSVGANAYTTGGTAQFTGVTETGTGTSVVTVTVDATNGCYDDTYFELEVVTGGTIGATGITFKVSLDAGRRQGPLIALGTASTYAVTNQGYTLNFAAGDLVAGDIIRFSTVAMATDASGIAACLSAILASPYAATGWGSTHIVGVSDASLCASIGNGSPGLDQLAAGYSFTRAITSARDASPPVAWGGTGETGTAWAASLLAAYSAASQKRVASDAGYYNMASAFATSNANTPLYRRPLAWAHAVRQVQIQPQTHAGRVKDGALKNITVDPLSDPLDGFYYHDERNDPSLDFFIGGTGRFGTARTRGTPGFYLTNPLLLSPAGSDFTMLPYGFVMDVACTVTRQRAELLINSDIRLNTNGTIFENEARSIEDDLNAALKTYMTSVGMISSAVTSVNRTNNVRTTSKVLITVTIGARGYILEIDAGIGFANPNAA